MGIINIMGMRYAHGGRRARMRTFINAQQPHPLIFLRPLTVNPVDSTRYSDLNVEFSSIICQFWGRHLSPEYSHSTRDKIHVLRMHYYYAAVLVYLQKTFYKLNRQNPMNEL